MKPFLTAEWKNLVMFNYAADAALLRKYLPAGTEVDTWNDTCYVSLVGFMFLNTKVRGIKTPYFTNFEEFNLRFYVRFKEQGVWKRGVVFIKEIVPKRLISTIANSVYGEHYYCYPMRSLLILEEDTVQVKYEWKYKGEWNFVNVKAGSLARELQPGSEAEFITEHYWGYTRLAADKTSEYKVEHPRWNIHPVYSYGMYCNTWELYGPDFHTFLKQEPVSVFMAGGSAVKVYPRKIWKL
ncbi:MAG TPA: DUF2071 domain-containing protein [Chitinophagaceae bacterium]|nr:DUF2071 domain-containing protein [Chitinophagaceae bacterium]